MFCFSFVKFDNMVLEALDLLLTLSHLAVIGFNLFGWIWRSLRRAHLICIGLTAASWLLLGLWYGIGYCPLTDWQWQVKRKLGEPDLPASFIKYFSDKLSGHAIDPVLVDLLTAIFFILAAAFSIYVNFFRKEKA